MMVMVAAHAGGLVHYLAGKHPGKIGWLLSPSTGWKEPRDWLPYAVDNGKFVCWTQKRKWSEDAFYSLLDRCKLCAHKPKWVLVPDEVADKRRTLELWNEYAAHLRALYGWPLAFAVQDGMTPKDVPQSAEMVFVGGSDEFKWRNTALFVASFPKVHVGRVNWWDKIEYCERLGVESIDGTGFFRAGELGPQGRHLRRFIEGERHTHPDFFERGSRSGVEP